MKPFDLQAVASGKTIVDSGNERWEVAVTELFGESMFFARKSDGSTGPMRLTPHGLLLASDVQLYTAGDKYVGWTNVYKDALNGYTLGKKIHPSDEIAKSLGGDHRIATIKIEWED